MPNGVLFKSASTRGGTLENITIRGVTLQSVPTAISVQLNWNPAFSYAKIPEGLGKGTLPEGLTAVPDYWRILAAPVSPEQGLPHIRNIRISDLKAMDSSQAFGVSAYPEAVLRDFEFRNLDIQAKTAGSIQNAQDWKFTDTRITAADGSHVTVKDSKGIVGLP